MTKFQTRIIEALQKFPRMRCDESELAHALYPDGKSWRCQANGGPPGLQMGLSRSLTILHRAGVIEQFIKGPGPGQRFVYLVKSPPQLKEQ